MEVNGEEKYPISSIEDSQMYRNGQLYLMRWTGYDSHTREPAKFFDGLQAVDEIHQQYLQKPAPLQNVVG